MSHLRSALHAGVYVVLLLAAAAVVHQTADQAETAFGPRMVDTAAAVGFATTEDLVPDEDLERALVARAKRVSRSAARPARVAPRTVIEAVTWVAPMSSYELTGRFGDQSSLWSSGVHTGLDFAAPSGTPIRSIAAGRVTQASYDGPYGYKTVVTLPGGGEAWYAHQERLGVRKGQYVAAGQVLGYVGATGNVTGSHLHLEIRYGDQPVDPAAVLAREGVNL